MLNESERQRLAEIDARLRASDPGLARALSRVEEPPHRRNAEEPPHRDGHGNEEPARHRNRGMWICVAALAVAPWMGALDGWPLLTAAALTLATLLWGVWLLTSLSHHG